MASFMLEAHMEKMVFGKDGPLTLPQMEQAAIKN